MLEILDKSAELLWLHFWQVTLLIGAVSLLNSTLLKKRRHWAYIMWILVLLKCVTPPVWSSSVGIFSWAERENIILPEVVTDQYVFTPMESAERIPLLPSRQNESVDDHSKIVESQAVTTEVLPARPPQSWAQILAEIWLVGFIVFIVWVVQRQIACHRVVRRCSEPCENTAVKERMKELAQEIGVRRDVELLTTPLDIGPATFGILKPRIILPKSLVATDTQQNLDLVLAHELTHVRRWDTLHALLQTLAQAIWWFHPLVWWSNRQIVRQREHCCDEELVATLRCDPGEYADCLMNVIRESRVVRALPGSAGIGPLELTLQRLEMIMNFNERLNARTPRTCWLILGLLAVVVLPGAGILTASEPVKQVLPAEKLELVETITEPDLRGASFVEMRPKGKQVYVTSWQAAAINIFDRNKKTGILTEAQIVKDGNLAGVTDLQISANGQIVVVACCHAKTVVSFERGHLSGRLSQLDVQRDAAEGSDGLYWPIDIAISPDSRFVYVADERHPKRFKPGSEKGDVGRITVLKITDKGQLEPVQTLLGSDRCLDGIRSICAHPDGRTLFATCWEAGTLVVLNRDVKTGRLSIRQVLSSKSKRLSVLNGVMTADCSPDGQFVYTVSGRFTDKGPIRNILEPSGESVSTIPQGVGVFRLTSDGRLSTVQTIRTGGEGEIELRGGNQLLVSHNGSRLFVSGTTSGTLVSFVRNPQTGKLTLEQTLSHNEPEMQGLDGANGIAESSDGRFLYVTGEKAGAISVLKRVVSQKDNRQE